jgi:deoxycytidine triphosphate deaminase
MLVGEQADEIVGMEPKSSAERLVLFHLMPQAVLLTFWDTAGFSHHVTLAHTKFITMSVVGFR